MKKLAVIISSILLSSAATAADSYQSISNLGFQHEASSNNNTVAVDSIYYLAPKNTLGPYDQFEYINKQSNVYGGYADDDFGDVTAIGGEYFIENFMLGASYSNLDSGSHREFYTLSGGYFFNPNLLAKVTLVENKDGEDFALFDLAYNHMLNSTDYVGVTLTADDDFDYRAVAAKYFIDLSQGNYLTFEGKYESIDDAPNQWQLETNYYFTKATSVFANYNKQDNYSFGAQHFINKNVGIKVGYGNNADDSGNDAYFANMRFQF